MRKTEVKKRGKRVVGSGEMILMKTVPMVTVVLRFRLPVQN